MNITIRRVQPEDKPQWLRMRLALYREGLANDDDWQAFLDQWVF